MKTICRVGKCRPIPIFLLLTQSAILSSAGPITLPTPIFLETFDAATEGSLPTGWYATNFSSLPQANFNLVDLNSAPYAGWVVVDRNRFNSNFLSYSSHTPVSYSRVLSSNPANVVNGQVVTNLATGKFVFATSAWRDGNQVQYLWSPDFNLSGRTNIYVSYHGIWDQNQDSLGAVEYSIDGGSNWQPIVYMLDGPDVLTFTNGAVDAIKTFTNRYADVATYIEPGTGITRGG